MTHACPECGTPFELAEHTIRVRVGSCPGCHRTYTLLPHAPALAVGGATVLPASPEGAEADLAELEPAGALPGSAEEGEDEEEEDETGPAPEGAAAGASEKDERETPVCGSCGSDLVFRAADEVTIEVYCPKCEETTRFRAEGAGRSGPGPSERPERGPPRSWSQRRPRPEGRGRGFEEAPRARGCRLCGGPIDFQPTEDGGREGVCRNCGNRFRLPPRDDDRRTGRGPGPGARGGRGRRDYEPRRYPPRKGRGGPPRSRRPSRRSNDEE